MKNGLNSSKNELYTVRRKLVEMINWWTIWKFCGIIICGLHFDKRLRINYEKYDEKNVMISDTSYDQWCYDSIIYQIHIYNYYKYWRFKGMKKCNK